MASLRAQGGRTGARQRKPRALRMTTPLLPLTQLRALAQQYEGRPLPQRLLRQLERHGSAVLKQGGYTTGLERFRLPEVGGLRPAEAKAALQGRILAPPVTRATPRVGVQLRPEVVRAQEETRRAQHRALARFATIGLGVGAIPAGYLLLRTNRGRAVAGQLVRHFHPLRPLEWTLAHAQNMLRHGAAEKVRAVSATLQRQTRQAIDTAWNKLVGEGEVPGLIDRADERLLKRPLARLARRLRIPVSTRWQTSLPAATRSRQLWADVLRTGQAEGRIRVGKMKQTLHGRKPVVQGGGIPVYETGYYQLRRLSPTVIRRRQLR